jgi:hypothetical protein
MAPRANWKGYLRLSLVSCPIALYPASSLSEKVTTTAADPNVTLQLQKNCEKLAEETFRRETADNADRVGYRAHYNARLTRIMHHSGPFLHVKRSDACRRSVWGDRREATRDAAR